MIQAFFDEDADGNLVEAERLDEETFTRLGTASRESAIAELCRLLKINWKEELKKDRALAAEQAQADFKDAEGADEEKPAVEPPEPRTIAEVHALFRRWLGDDYDLITLDAALAAAAAERLPGDPAWHRA